MQPVQLEFRAQLQQLDALTGGLPVHPTGIGDSTPPQGAAAEATMKAMREK